MPKKYKFFIEITQHTPMTGPDDIDFSYEFGADPPAFPMGVFIEAAAIMELRALQLSKLGFEEGMDAFREVVINLRHKYHDSQESQDPSQN